MTNPITATVETFAPIAAGMKLTMKHFLRMINPVTKGETQHTVQYPEERREQFPRTRWRHYLTRYDNGLEKCIGCSLCAGACPARCIYVQAAENTDDARYSPGERYAARYEINMLRCIFCGYCQDACPTGAIVLRKDFELSEYTREDALYTKEMLLEPMPPSAIVPKADIKPADRDFTTAGASRQTNVVDGGEPNPIP